MLHAKFQVSTSIPSYRYFLQKLGGGAGGEGGAIILNPEKACLFDSVKSGPEVVGRKKSLVLSGHQISSLWSSEFFWSWSPCSPPPRDMKRTNLVYEEEVNQLLQSDMSIKQTIQSLHTQTVSKSVATLKPNVVLKDKPPDIHPAESKPSRKVRSGLARLRSV